MAASIFSFLASVESSLGFEAGDLTLGFYSCAKSLLKNDM